MSYERIQALDPGFSDAEATSVEGLRDAWRDQREGLAESGALAQFNERLVRRWAIETGIIERLYSLDRGTTEILVNQGLNTALIEHNASDLPPAELIAILEDHREAAAHVTDHVAAGRPLTLGFIKELHSLLTRNQGTVTGIDQFGRQAEYQLLRGAWKQTSNNPRRPDGVVHEYCPPHLVQEQMEVLLSELGNLRSAPTMTRAAWLHHRFTQVHPFQDGNGRTARALTSFVLIAAACFPIVIDRDNRAEYIDSLEAADAGNIRPLTRLFAQLEKQELERALSLSADTLADEGAGHDRTRRMSAIRARARERRDAIDGARKGVLETAIGIFNDDVVPALDSMTSELDAVLREELPGSAVTLERSSGHTRHYFKAQLVDIAQQEGYYGDFSTLHEWARIRIQRPGENDDAVSEIVFSVHGLGRQFSGVVVLAAYYATRFLDEDGRSVTLKPHKLAGRSLTFSYRDTRENIRVRVKEWLDGALDESLVHVQGSM